MWLAQGPCCTKEPGLPDRFWDAGSLFFSDLHRRHNRRLVHVVVCACKCVCPCSLGLGPRCMCVCRRRGVGHYRIYIHIYIYILICVCSVSWVGTRVRFEALVHISERAVRMRARLLTLRAIIGRTRRDTNGTASPEGFEPQADSSLLVDDPGGPA